MTQQADFSDEIIYGKHAVREALKEKRQINKVFFQKGMEKNQFSDIFKLVKQRNLILQEVPKAKLDALTQDGNHQGVVLSLPAYAYANLEDAFNLAEQRGEAPFLFILDEIEDPHNLGSIIRTADAMGVHGIILPKRRSATLTGTVAKVSTGAIEHVPVIRVTNLSQTVKKLQDKGVWVFASAMEGEDIRQWDSHGSIAVVIGNEGSGVSASLLKACDGTVTIPMTGHVQSLNASVAAGIFMYEVARHRIASIKGI
ncbi:23S rRNA (guanosine(2251)-2'-O)-methyltransferase RlmB [Suicoccus acidiformans]|uniref:23S rRNA (Guanosine(2251)-2'-O)-methyltransferase RlmB n=1 Tax=Suicoccus acidiformans TaxID=2036206 RepID=A0A347WNK0_9LACT|nr:23S rRNA (guanosine(2251)-2'-O)-methyltransferase RlmB [Suicoccus acidiformans]AXY26657.1 23S rRNA (guanosine(2251)-2'-O)-methyltransferase RlmB [Suicoccus acidiformans]